MQPLTLTGWMRWALVQEFLPPDVRTVLEIGAGLGSTGARLAARFDYTGVEPDAVSRATAEARIGSAVVDSVDSVDSVFDLVCAFEVIEHIEREEDALVQWRKRSKRWLMVSTPAGPERFGAWDEAAGHYRRHTSLTLLSSLRASGWEPMVIRRYGYPFGELLDRWRQEIAWYRTAGVTIEERTDASARNLQPPHVLGFATWMLSRPMCWLQRPFPHRGNGLIALAERTQ